ncbi:hypothetical protein [Kribbella sp. NPDC051718]|uniref:hypothetical protein n=1 Tax=Kribbella sp. NPDC051718 TaxID=3155168 RepID=UPI003440C483
MHKPLAAVTAALILLTGTQLPAWAAGPDAPTSVQVSWAEGAAARFKMAWSDGGEPNRVRVEYEDSDPWVYLAETKSAAPNEIILGVDSLRKDKVARIFVVTVDEAGAESTAAYSPWFDTNLPATAKFSAAAALPDGSVRLNWYRDQEPPQDTTPNDSLDRPSTSETVVPVLEAPSGDSEAFPVPMTARTTTIPPRPRPYRLWLRTHNEWGTKSNSDGATVKVTSRAAALDIAAVGQYSSTVRFTATAGFPDCAPAACGNGMVYLQARANATKPWATVGSYDGQPLRFSAATGVPGGRQYRLYVPAYSWLGGDFEVAPAIATTPRYSAAQAKYSVVGFNTTSAKVGQLVKATVNVLPAGTVKANLQWFDGKVWRHAAYIPLTKGKGTLSFKASGRGTTRSWRVTVPAMSMNGLPILATTSRTFKLAVR